MIIKHAKTYLKDLIKSIDKLPLEKIEKISDELKKAYKGKKHIFIMGNGGSAATASHFVCDLSKGTTVSGKKRFRVVGLTDNVPLMTAWGNDVSYEDIFKAQLENIVEKRDVVIVFTGSGNSPNIIKAVKYSNSVGAVTIGFTGFNGGKLKGCAKISLVVPSKNMERIEDIHLILEHLIKLFLFEEIRTGRI
jgi:D-sedoheptulose 7-phosphate isomerase